jgi:hypothetical protein
MTCLTLVIDYIGEGEAIDSKFPSRLTLIKGVEKALLEYLSLLRDCNKRFQPCNRLSPPQAVKALAWGWRNPGAKLTSRIKGGFDSATPILNKVL